jgi:hypothetical protein
MKHNVLNTLRYELKLLGERNRAKGHNNSPMMIASIPPASPNAAPVDSQVSRFFLIRRNIL